MKKIWVCLIGLISICRADEKYGENLKLQKIGDAELKAEFRFWSWRESEKEDKKDFEVFPRILDELIDEYDVKYLMVVMGQGRWKDQWGQRTQPSAIHGAQVYAEFEAENEQRADKKLQFLIEALNGILCTSLSQISLITSPQLPIFNHPKNSGNIYRRYGILSGETTCTENLTRLRKLLACRQSGISTLLHPSKLYDVMYHSSHLVVRKIEKKSEMTVGVDIVVKNRDNNLSPWRLSEVFGKHLTTRCTVAEESEIWMNSKVFDMQKNSELFDIDFAAQDIQLPASSSLIRAWTSQGGSDQQNGVLHLNVVNDANPSTLIISQILPYFVQARYSKIHVTCRVSRKIVKSSKNEKSSVLLQYEIELNAGGKCEISIPFDKKLLRLDDYPPDANHGMHIPAAVILVAPKNDDEEAYTIHTNTLLVALPVPDFSMPFNVICFVATAFALIFGPLQLYSTMWLAPVQPASKLWPKINRLILLFLIFLCLYAHFMEVNLNEVRREIEKYLEKLNELR